MSRQLIINCDDLGMHPAINRGITELLSRGPIRSCSIMATGAWFGQACDMVQRLGITRVGVHLALEAEYPALPMRPLTGGVGATELTDANGHFVENLSNLPALPSTEAVHAELRAQVQRVIDSGLGISHLDGHMFFYETGRVGARYRHIVRALATELGVPWRDREVGIPVRQTYFTWNELPDAASRLAHYQALPTRLGPGLSELIIHPGMGERAMREFTSVPWRRQADFDFFADSQRLARLLDTHGIELIGWQDLPTAMQEVVA